MSAFNKYQIRLLTDLLEIKVSVSEDQNQLLNIIYFIIFMFTNFLIHNKLLKTIYHEYRAGI
jgi:hypothetical protein